MITDNEILEGIPQMNISTGGNPPTEDASKVQKAAYRVADSERTETVSMLPELTALDPDAVAEELKRQRKKRSVRFQ